MAGVIASAYPFIANLPLLFVLSMSKGDIGRWRGANGRQEETTNVVALSDSLFKAQHW